MGDIVNLRRARKQRARRAKDEAAQVNRAAHGRSKAERELTAAQTRLEAVKLDGHRRARDAEDQA
ncbi:MAG: DUF4169 family protein [Alphaproteobacteria bacterium]|nr:DUF4169 family protein [Alphaproteobacteria bacterium]MBM3623814.1 DUF4169 family protein [Alphaproteobacteria bacterium]